MKKTLKMMGMAMLMALTCLPAVAQLNGTGYYRFRNAQRTGEYIAICNDKFNYTTVISGAGGGLLSLAFSSDAKDRAMKCATAFLQNDIHMVDDPDIIDLSTVIYAKKRNTDPDDYEYNLIGQGTSLLTLTTATYPGSIQLIFKELYTTIKSVSGSGANTLYTAYMPLKASNNSQADLGIRYFVDQDGKFDTDVSSVASQAKARWYIEPVTHINVQPEVELNGKYYTTVAAPFAFTLSGMVEKAYKITTNTSGILAYEEITGTIPAGTPVLLQCGSPNIADCRLIPTGAPQFTAPVESTESGAPAALDAKTPAGAGNNLLAGTYYCNTDGQVPYTNKNNGTSYLDGNHRELVSDNYYVIGKNADGKLGFLEAKSVVFPTTVTAMPANKAWMLSGGLFPTVATPTFTPAAGEYTGELTVTIACETPGATIHYTTDGSEPTVESPVCNGTITVGEGTTTIKAIAVMEGPYNNSTIAEAAYTILPAATHKPGDINHDGIVDVDDVTAIINAVLGKPVPEGFCRICADVRTDNIIDVDDVAIAIGYVLGTNHNN